MAQRHPTEKNHRDDMDLIDQLTQLDTFPDTLALRHRRDKIVAASQGSYDALFDPTLPGLGLRTRLQVAERVAALSDSSALQQHYASRLDTPGLTQDSAAISSAALVFAEKLTRRPVDGDRAAIDALLAAGLDAPAIITLAQLIAFVTFQVRVIAGLDALKHSSAPAADAVTPPADTAPFVHPAHLPKPGETLNIKGYTSASLDWKAWVPVLQLDQATPEQLAILEASHPTAKTSDYYLALIQQPRILQERSTVFNAIMYAPGGMSRAERELASTVVSRVNGCVYCASVHAQRFEQLAKRNDVIAQVFEDPDTAGTNARERAIVQLALTLTRQPGHLAASDLQALYAAGLTAAEILDGIHSIAIFAWANRLMLNLGEHVWPVQPA